MWWWIACGRVAPVPECGTGDCRADIVDLAVGDEFGCVRRANGHVQCWGRNQAGQRGNGAFLETHGATDVVADALAISAGQRHACVVRVGGGVACWGANDRGQVSREAGDWAGPRRVGLPGPMVEVAAGWTTSCARDAAGAVWCWGDDVPAPRRVPGVVAVALANGRTPCAREASGDVVCWPAGPVVRYPVHATDLAVDREIAALADGRILVWTPDGEAREVGRVAGATDLAVVRGGVYAASRTGELWGFTTGDAAIPLPIGRGEAVAGRAHSACALADGVVSCWGPDAAGLVPRGILRPRLLDARGELHAAGATTCVLGAGMTCYAESGRHTSASGDEATRVIERMQGGDRLACSREPGGAVVCVEPGGTPVARDIGARDVAVGGRFACAVSGAGEVSCWEGVDGLPQSIAGLPPVTRVAVGANLACAADGGVWCWNQWRSGIAGSAAPVSVGVTDAEDITAGMAFGCALQTSGAVSCWGANERGQLGDGTTRGRTAAAIVPLPGPARRIDAGNSHACAELADGAVWCWGHPGGLGERAAENAPDHPVRAPVE
jgi:alpha-tubulin suppressor-like RCC1 family protein